MSDAAIVVFTARGFGQILSERGSQAWKLDAPRARKCTYLVCTQNRHHDYDWAKSEAPHGTAFLIGKVDGIEPAVDTEETRWLVRISEYARIDVPNAWDGSRYPVRYVKTMEELVQYLGIDPATLQFQPVPESGDEKLQAPTREEGSGGVRPLTIAQAKKGLALQFGVGIDTIEITIRG